VDTRDDQAAPTRPIPGFRPRGALLLDPPQEGIPPANHPDSPAKDSPESAGGFFGPPTLRPEPNGTRTATSDTTGEVAPKPTVKDTAVLVAGVLGLVVTGVALLVRLRRGVQLRRPTKTELDDIAKPLAGLATRHVPAGILNKDLGDVIAAGAAAGAYLNNGPLIEHDYVDDGLPDNLQGDLS
jgi:hypothetical protein